MFSLLRICPSMMMPSRAATSFIPMSMGVTDRNALQAANRALRMVETQSGKNTNEKAQESLVRLHHLKQSMDTIREIDRKISNLEKLENEKKNQLTATDYAMILFIGVTIAAIFRGGKKQSNTQVTDN